MNQERGIIMGRFIVKTTDTGVKFDLKAENGEIVATSEVYTTEDACKNGIESVRKNCVGGIEDQTVENYEEISHPKYEVYLDNAGKYRFRLKAKNGQIVAIGQAYQEKDSCLQGIESIRQNAPDSEIEIGTEA